MKTKHTPATPLPWREGQAGQIGTNVNDSAGRSVASTDTHRWTAGERELQDAAYIAHAANSYPKLVEALRRSLQMFEGDFGPDHISTHHRALLKELGE